jgi:5-methylcytosine-specific restriction endonuclease McrA
MTYVAAPLRSLVRERARERCEYCLFPDTAGFYPHEIDHVIAEKHGGRTIEDNLCLSCWVCNRHKGSDLTSIDPQTEAITPLFHPRRDRWEDHFRLAGGVIEGTTPQGRTTARMLHFNDPDQVELRAALIVLGQYPDASGGLGRIGGDG